MPVVLKVMRGGERPWDTDTVKNINVGADGSIVGRSGRADVRA